MKVYKIYIYIKYTHTDTHTQVPLVEAQRQTGGKEANGQGKELGEGKWALVMGLVLKQCMPET